MKQDAIPRAHGAASFVVARLAVARLIAAIVDPAPRESLVGRFEQAQADQSVAHKSLNDRIGELTRSLSMPVGPLGGPERDPSPSRLLTLGVRPCETRLRALQRLGDRRADGGAFRLAGRFP